MSRGLLAHLVVRLVVFAVFFQLVVVVWQVPEFLTALLLVIGADIYFGIGGWMSS